MFERHQKHPSDCLLLCAIDGELSARRMAIVDAHVRHCGRCRARFAALAALGDEVTHVCRTVLSRPTSHERLRTQLRTRMTSHAAIWNRSRWFRLRRAVGRRPFMLRMGLSVAVLVLMASAIWVPYAMRTRTPAQPEMEAAALPIHALTPGAVRPVPLDALCAGRFVEKPSVPASVRDVVLREYRMEHVAAREYELDYLITPELGGLTDARNLWPERYATRVWNARVKDDLEQLLPQLICRGQLDLATAQHDIADNWIAAYKKYFKTGHPISTRADRLDDNDVPGFASARHTLDTFGLVLVTQRIERFAQPIKPLSVAE